MICKECSSENKTSRVYCGGTPVAITVRPRWKRVLRFPLTVRRHYKVTPNLRMALRLAALTLKEYKHPLNK